MSEVESMEAFLASWQQGQPCCWQPSFGQWLSVTDHPVPQLLLSIDTIAQRDEQLRELLVVRYQQPERYSDCFISADDSGALVLIHPLQQSDNLQAAITTLQGLSNSQPD